MWSDLSRERICGIVPAANWRRLSARLQASEALLEGVPSHLFLPLVGWAIQHSDEDTLVAAAVGARLALGESLVGLSHPTYRRDALVRGLNAAAPKQAEKLLDLIDALLRLMHESYGSPRDDQKELEQFLELGGSSWRINSLGDALERRVDESVRAAVEEAIAAAQSIAPSAAAHLTEAWKFAYGRSPNASKVFSEAIKGVEAAAAPVVTPIDLKATLGKIIGQMKAAPAAWTVAIANTSVQLVIGMMDSLWDGQTDRHAGVRPTVAVTAEAAEAALHLAATLVHWFTRGAVTKK